MKRVVVTGVGAVTPVGLDAPSTWAAMLEGQSGVGKVTHFDASDYPVQIAGEVKGFDATGRIEPKELRRLPRSRSHCGLDRTVVRPGSDPRAAPARASR